MKDCEQVVLTTRNIHFLAEVVDAGNATRIDGSQH